MIDLTPGAVDVDGAIKTQTKRFCDDCSYECTVAQDSRCAKTDAIVENLKQRRESKGQQQRTAGA